MAIDRLPPSDVLSLLDRLVARIEKLERARRPDPAPTVSGARDIPEAALADLLTELDSLGIITDTTTAT